MLKIKAVNIQIENIFAVICDCPYLRKAVLTTVFCIYFTLQ